MIVKLKNRKLCLNILIQWSVCLALCFLSIIHHQQPFGFANAETQPSYASRPSYAGQIGLWTFQEGAGNATDTSGFGTAASLALLGTNPFTWNTAPVGITRTTAAGTGRATTASPVGKLTLQPNSTQQLAVELAFSLDSIAQDCTLLDVRSSSNGCEGDNYALEFAAGTMSFSLHTNATACTQPSNFTNAVTSPNTLYHVVISYSSSNGTQVAYVNGQTSTNKYNLSPDTKISLPTQSIMRIFNDITNTKGCSGTVLLAAVHQAELDGSQALANYQHLVYTRSFSTAIGASQLLTVAQNGNVTITLSQASTDHFGNSLTAAVKIMPTNGALNVAQDQVVGTPYTVSYQASSSFVGVDTFNVTLNNGILESQHFTISINITLENSK
eukprot:TRINITY_DN3500_c0_g1_i2.p1 TRINITY_DN3500_c0_g1~~TRINITY_DN3500_c0_g1_i2.p1  ORF type:complete len:400 (-),score=64.81 TRINITY_DN3500_c0_g1_i2:800-1954(-)